MRAVRSGPLRHRWFALFTATITSGSIGDEVMRLALPLLVLDLTHDIGAAATLRVIETVPYVLFGAFAGALIDRTEKRRLLSITTILSVLFTIVIPLSVTFGFFSIGLLYVIAFLLGTVEVVWGITADFSIVPALVQPDELTEANATYLTADRVARIVGPSLGGLSVGALALGSTYGSANALWLSALLYLPSLVVFMRMPPLHDVDPASVAPLTVANVRSEVGEGFTFIWRNTVLRALFVLMFISNFGSQGMNTLLLFVLREEYRLDAVTIGLALSFTGVIQIFGSAFAPRLARGRPLGQTMLGVVAVAAVASGAAAFARTWQMILLAVTGRQLAWSAHIVYAFIPRQREVPAALRGRVNGAFRTLILISNTASPAFLSAIAAAYSTAAAFAAAGALGLLSVAVSALGPLRQYDIRDAPAEAAAVEPVAESEPTPAD
jgi:predicted MFS family arabinose efflux permease